MAIEFITKTTEAQQIEMPEPFHCLMTIAPMTVQIEAKYVDMGGFKQDGIVRTPSGETKVMFPDNPTERQLKANAWLMKRLIRGWQGFEVKVDGEVVSDWPFEPANVQLIADDYDRVAAVIKEAKRLAGTLKEEEEKN